MYPQRNRKHIHNKKKHQLRARLGKGRDNPSNNVDCLGNKPGNACIIQLDFTVDLGQSEAGSEAIKDKVGAGSLRLRRAKTDQPRRLNIEGS